MGDQSTQAFPPALFVLGYLQIADDPGVDTRISAIEDPIPLTVDVPVLVHSLPLLIRRAGHVKGSIHRPAIEEIYGVFNRSRLSTSGQNRNNLFILI